MTEQRWPVGGESVAYGYSTGRLRVLETHLLTGAELEAAVRQGNAFSWNQLLDQLEYPEGEELLQRIAHARQEADELLVQLCTEKPLAYGLLLYQCYHNLKVFLKSLLPSLHGGVAMERVRQSGIPESLNDLLFWGSPEKPEGLWELMRRILNQDQQAQVLSPDWRSWSEEEIGLDQLRPDSFLKTGIPPVYGTAIQAAADAYAQTGEVGRIDSVLDFYYFAHLAALGHGSKQAFLQTYAGLRSDLANLNALYRMVRMKMDRETAAQYWVPGGQLQNVEAFVALLEADQTAWREAFEATPVVELAQQAYAFAHQVEAMEKGSFARRSDNLIMDLAQTGLEVIYGPQVVAGYWLARQTEAQNLRLLLSLQAQNQKPEALLSLLREVYIHG